MYSKTAALLTVSILSLSAWAVPAPSGTAEIVTLPIPTQLGFPTGTVTLSDAVSFVNAHSSEIASAIGTPMLQSIEAKLGVMEAANAIGTQTALTAYVTDINSTPVVEVSSIGGSAITIATGTAGAATTFAGQVFNVVPGQSSSDNSNGAEGIRVSRSLLTGAAAILGSMLVGALAAL